MPRFIFIALILIWGSDLSGQQLYMEVFSGRNRTSFDLPQYKKPTWFFPLGVKVAGGSDHLQIGAECSFDLSKPSLDYRDTEVDTVIGTHRYQHTYLGLLLRGKISRYPARRFGLTFTTGAGFMGLSRTSNIEGEPASLAYSTTPSFNVGTGISFPTQGFGMVELGYTYYFVNYSKTDDLPDMNGSFFSIHIGYSFNFVFGKRATAYEKIRKF